MSQNKGTVGSGKTLQDSGEDILPGFQTKINQARSILDRIEQNTAEIKSLKSNYGSAISSGEEKCNYKRILVHKLKSLLILEISKQLDNIIKDNNDLNRKLGETMKIITSDVQESQKAEPNARETQMKSSLQHALLSRADGVLRASQEEQIDYKKGLKQKISRQTKYLDGNLTNEEIEQICNDPNKGNELLQNKIMGSASVGLQNAVSDIQDRYRDIQKLEQSVAQVHQLFIDMAMLVQQQGEMIDDIELNINTAQQNVNQGEKQLQKAKQHHQAARQKMCCIMVGGLAIIAVIVGPILASK